MLTFHSYVVADSVLPGTQTSLSSKHKWYAVQLSSRFPTWGRVQNTNFTQIVGLEGHLSGVGRRDSCKIVL